MKIPLQEFEQHIDPTILKRGFQYFKKGHVDNIDELSGGEYEATVEGTETYTVNLTVRNDVMTESVCTCPYDMGPICKHVVAVMFYLQKDILDVKPTKTRKPTDKTKPAAKKPKTVAEQVDLLVGKLSQDELVEFVRDSCMKDRMFRQMFFAKYEYLITPVSKELYAKQISALVKAFKDRDGWIGYSEVRKLGNATGEMIKTAQDRIVQNDYKTAFYIATAVMEEMTKALQFAEDNDGDVGGAIEEALEIFHSLAEKQLPEPMRKELFDYTIASYDKKIFDDSHWSMLYLAVSLQKNDSETRIIQERLGRVKPEKNYNDWNYRTAQKIQHQLIERTKGGKSSVAFMEMNISNPDFRATLIEQAIADKLYDRAIDFAKEGVEQNKKDYPGLATKWQEYLLDVYVATNDVKKATDWARHFLVTSSNRDIEKYYKLLKGYISTMDWDTFIDGAVAEIKSRYYDYNRITRIYIWEKSWDKYLKLLTLNPSLERIQEAEKHLAPQYAKELAELYRVEIMKYMVKNISRSHYQTACRYLRRVIKLGARPVAEHVAAELRRLYPQRRALMEELDMV